MEVKIKLSEVDNLNISTKLDKDGDLITQVKFEFPGKVSDLARLIGLQSQKRPLYAIIGCSQAMFDLSVERVKEKEGEGKAGKDDVADIGKHLSTKVNHDGKGDQGQAFEEANPGAAKVKV